MDLDPALNMEILCKKIGTWDGLDNTSLVWYAAALCSAFKNPLYLRAKKNGLHHSKMTSRLESVPPDVLQHIAFFIGSCVGQTALTDLLHLLLTSSTVYNGLSLHACPHLYADIFRATFDTPAPWRDCVVTDSALVAEFLCRRRVIRRVQHVDFSVMGLRQDLWTAIWMILESQGLNESHLFLAKFHNYILMLLRDLKEAIIATHISHGFEMTALAVWLFSMTISRSGSLASLIFLLFS